MIMENVFFFAAILTSALQIHGIHTNASIMGPCTVVTVPIERQLITSLSLITIGHVQQIVECTELVNLVTLTLTADYPV